MAAQETLETRLSKLDWCWKCTKRCLQTGDVLFEEGDIFCQLATKYVPVDVRREITYARVEEFPCCISKCTKVFDSIAKYESHYNSCHRNVCGTCGRTYPTAHLLDIHMLETHDTMFSMLAEKQPMFQCLLETCGSKFKDAKSRRNHMIKLHQYPANYRYDQKKQRSPKQKGTKENRVLDAKQKQTKINVTNTDHGDHGNTVSMETDTSADTCSGNSEKQPQGRIFKYNAPKSFSFGHGISRGFLPGRSRGRGRDHKHKKHWHSVGTEDMNTAVDIEHVDMNELSVALS